jgi:hypothetical protein
VLLLLLSLLLIDQCWVCLQKASKLDCPAQQSHLQLEVMH